MKKLIFPTLAVILLMVSFNDLRAGNNKTESTTEVRKIIIRIEIEFGGTEPQCPGKGLCTWSFDITRGIIGTVNYDGNGNTLSLSFSRKDVETYQPDKLQYLDGETFELPKNFVLNEEQNRRLGATKPVVLKAGSYPLTFENGIYTVTFDNL
jgi:hypothetical protein